MPGQKCWNPDFINLCHLLECHSLDGYSDFQEHQNFVGRPVHCGTLWYAVVHCTQAVPWGQSSSWSQHSGLRALQDPAEPHRVGWPVPHSRSTDCWSTVESKPVTSRSSRHCIIVWLVVSIPLKNNSQLGWLFPIYGKIKNVPNHQPVVLLVVWIHQKSYHTSIIHPQRAISFTWTILQPLQPSLCEACLHRIKPICLSCRGSWCNDVRCDA